MAYDKTEPIKSASPQQSPGMFAGPPPATPTTSVRILRFVAAAVPATVVLSLAVAGFDAILPDAVKPSALYGNMLGRGHVAETRTQQDVVVENTRRMAEAQAAANARAQMEVIAFQQQQQALIDSMQVKIGLVNGADVICTLGPVGIVLFYGPNSYEGRNASQFVQASCSYATRTRQEIAATQAEIARLNSAIMERRTVMAGVH